MAPLAEQRLPAAVFYELLGFRAQQIPRALRAEAAQGASCGAAAVDRVQLGRRAARAVLRLAGSVSRRCRDAAAGRPPSVVHLGESPEEVRFLLTGAARGETARADRRVEPDCGRPQDAVPSTTWQRLGCSDRSPDRRSRRAVDDVELAAAGGRRVRQS